MSRTLVTGANGLIGAHVVRALLADGDDVRAFVRPTSDLAALADLPLELHRGDVLVAEDVAAAAEGCRVVFHTAVPFAYAGQVDDDVDRTATDGTTNVLHAAAAAGVERVVVTSSSVVFGHTTDAVTVDTSAGPVSASGQPGYVAAKIRQDRTTVDLAERLDLEVVLVAPTMAVGALAARLGPSNAVVVQYLADPTRATYPGGINVVAVEDVARGHLVAATAGIPGQRYVLGGDNLTWRQVHELIAELAGVDPPRWVATHTAAYLGAVAEEARARLGRRRPLVTRDQAAMIGRYYWYSHEPAARLGYAPAGARVALARAIAWLAGSRHVSREMRTSMHLHPDVVVARAEFAERELAARVRS
jgi:dihydroflavonol-4-reductase